MANLQKLRNSEEKLKGPQIMLEQMPPLSLSKSYKNKIKLLFASKTETRVKFFGQCK